MTTVIRIKNLVKKWFVVGICTIGIIITLIILLSFTDDKSFKPLFSLFPTGQVAVPEKKTIFEVIPVPLVGKPKRLTIPSLNIETEVIYVGLTLNGAMDVPNNPSDVAWFDQGPYPGNVGSAVISGHFGWKNGIPAVFDDLSKLQKGDNVYIEDENGRIITFVVNKIQTFGENSDAYDVFTSNDGKAHLNLVTCQGVWNKNKKSYSERLVIFTDKIE